MLVGVILVLAALLRLGFVANFISEPVLIGFKAGIGLVIVLDQVPKLLGIHFHKGSFFHNVLAIAQGIPGASMATVAVGAVMVGILVAVERFVPRAPAPLIAVASGIAAMSLFGLQAYGVATVGHVPTGLPSLTLPDLALIEQLWPAALGIALMSFTETIAAGRAFAESGEPTPQANRELLATGLANAGGALLGAMPAGGGTIADRREPAGRGAHTAGGAGHGRGHAGDDAAAGSLHRADAGGHARQPSSSCTRSA